MKLRAHFSKKVFSMGHVVTMLLISFVGIAVFSFAAVSVPHTFTAGTTAKADEVNANFQALANALPAVKSTGNTYMADQFITSTGVTSPASVSVTVPAAGYVFVSASGAAGFKIHNNGASSKLYLKLSDSNIDMTQGEGMSVCSLSTTIPSFNGDNGQGSVAYPLNMTRVFPAPSAGTYTYYLNARLGSAGPTGIVDITLNPLYVPSQLP